MHTETIPATRLPIAKFFRALPAKLRVLSRRVLSTRGPRRLRLSETLSLGNRGYIAVVIYGEQRFLIGGTNSSVALLTQLPNGTSILATRPEDESVAD